VSASAGLGWELGAGLGLVAYLCVVSLWLLPPRRRGALARPTLRQRVHRWLAWSALLLGMAHGVVLGVADPLVWRYLRPTLPWYQLAGVVGLGALLAIDLGPAVIARWRQRRSGRRSPRWHLLLSAAVLACLTIHVVVTGRYAAALAALSPVRAVARVLREPVSGRAGPLPLLFPHRSHAAINCIVCHHNYVDHLGVDTCFGCHRAARPDLRLGIEARMHDFCLHCHRGRAARHGPRSGCGSCHRRA
jgi:predicted CXXCH cytochrome family protein